ncbi:Cytochrome P450 [Minicystis rosea]|nr:Cytochrome P450 [Minicystis rosea]
MPSLPPGPRSTLISSFDLGLGPVHALARAHARYGDPFALPTFNGSLILTARPELIGEVLTQKDTELFEPFADDTLSPFFGTHSLLLIKGETHRRERRLLMPPFHGERMRAYGATMAEVAREAVAALAPGQAFRAIDLGMEISLEVIVRAVFGVEGRAQVDEHLAALKATLDATSPFFLFGKAFQRAPFGLGPWARYEASSARVDRLLFDQIERVRPRAAERTDILSLMVAARYDDGSSMTPQQIRDELRTLLIAGHETTAITLAWAFELIHRHPHVRDRLLAELDAAGDAPDELAKLPYLTAIVDETLRLRPVVEMVARKLRRPWTFAGYDLPTGATIAPAISLVHMRPDLYPDPLQFKPERMLEKKPGPFEYMPFGGGNRRCLGAAMSHYESCIVLATALRGFRFALREPEPVPFARRTFTVGPKTGVRMEMLGVRREAALRNVA